MQVNFEGKIKLYNKPWSAINDVAGKLLTNKNAKMFPVHQKNCMLSYQHLRCADEIRYCMIRHFRHAASKTHYEVLGVQNTASQKQIKDAYLDSCKKFHPDKHPGNTKMHATFVEIQESFDILGNVAKRKKYDRDNGIHRNIRQQAHGSWGNNARMHRHRPMSDRQRPNPYQGEEFDFNNPNMYINLRKNMHKNYDRTRWKNPYRFDEWDEEDARRRQSRNSFYSHTERPTYDASGEKQHWSNPYDSAETLHNHYKRAFEKDEEYRRQNPQGSQGHNHHYTSRQRNMFDDLEDLGTEYDNEMKTHSGRMKKLETCVVAIIGLFIFLVLTNISIDKYEQHKQDGIYQAQFDAKQKGKLLKKMKEEAEKTS